MSSETAKTWQLRSRTIQFGRSPTIMGILNVTPDSFSDGGRYFSPTQAVEQALKIEDSGADILDLGGESTRPYSEPVSSEEEIRRVAPVLEALQGRLAIPISIDTSKSSVAQAAIQLGAEILNDVTGLQGDSEMLALVAETGVGVCAMHMQGTPQTMQEAPQYQDVVSDIAEYLSQRNQAMLAAGIGQERICLDPGIGFGKTHEHNMQLLRHIRELHRLGRPLLVGHSRKGFVGKLIGDRDADRTAGTLAISMWLAQQGVQVLRVHDVEQTKQAFLCWEAVQ